MAANRANAKKSTGPTSPLGKTKSSRNAVTHGLTATHFILITEDIDDFNKFRQTYIARYAPRDRVKLDLVDRIVHAVWNEHRSWDIEHAIHNVQMVKNEPTVAAQYNNPPDRTPTALAIVDLAKEPALPLMQRYSKSLSFEARRAHDLFMDLRERLPLVPPEPPQTNRTQPSLVLLEPDFFAACNYFKPPVS